jgi:hypothetical protein
MIMFPCGLVRNAASASHIPTISGGDYRIRGESKEKEFESVGGGKVKILEQDSEFPIAPTGPAKRTRREVRTHLIVRDEFRPAIPRSGCSTAEPVSATGTRTLPCTPQMPGQKGTYLLCREGDISTLP